MRAEHRSSRIRCSLLSWGSGDCADAVSTKINNFSLRTSESAAAYGSAALRLLRKKPEQYVGRLKENAALMRRLLHDEDFEIIEGVTPIVPVLTGSSEKTMRFMAALLEAGIMVSGIRPPTVPEGTSRLRVTVTAAHTKAEIKQAAKTMGRIWRELKT